jgi:[acyl-carrier-protein] S-malonyltransferase
VSDPAEIAGLLVEQVTGQVRWRETVEWFGENGVDHTGRDRRRKSADRAGAPDRQIVTGVAMSTGPPTSTRFGRDPANA